ncbi:DUF648 domain-containing protein [Candidatus Chlamydia corallus]|uniref:DUF648 domain-containing protein n=1 Tax=Candidatus Chlamydia corallus TaxID=2038470 RepID=UPI000C2FA490
MQVYSFAPSVSTLFQHRLMAGIDSWFFLGGKRLKIVALDGPNLGYANHKRR